MQPTAWSPWQPLQPPLALVPEVLAETLDGGQAFRWHRSAFPDDADPHPDVWTGTWSDHVAQLRRRPDGVEWRAPVGREHGTGAALTHYLQLETDWTLLADALPHRSDPHLAVCLRHFPGLRILRQPFGETLLAFLCSATKQIVQIKQMLALLAARHGAPIGWNAASGRVQGASRTPRSTLPPCRAGSPSLAKASDFAKASTDKSEGRPHPAETTCRAGSPDPASAASGDAALQFCQLPTWLALAKLSERDLRSCQLGFRAAHISKTARFLAARPGWLEETEQLPYAEARIRLLELPGVGGKIADCILLFGAGRLEAFPVDTWILKTLARRYGLTGWKPAQLAQFGRVHFGPLAGLAQQYLFGYERSFR